MKKTFRTVLVIGAIMGLQSIAYGSAAAPAKPQTGKNQIVRLINQVRTVEYEKGIFEKDKTIIICGSRTVSGQTSCKKKVFLEKGGDEPDEILDSSMFDTLEKEYEEQEKAKKSAATEQVPGGYMAPTATGEWKPIKPGSSGSKEDK